MKSRNCPNCGAVIDNEHIKCPFCGTMYFDLSVMPINDPFFLKIRTDKGIVSSKVILRSVSITHAFMELPEIEMLLVALNGYEVQI